MNLKILKCNDKAEWETARYFRQKYFFGPNNILDPYTWTLNHPEHIHLVLYQDIEIIGYAHIQLWPDKRAAMSIIVINELKRNNNCGSKFLELCEKLLKSKGYKTLYAESSPAALAFYKKNGYIEMPFNDPDGYESGEEDIAVGKIL
ncbi:MAG TPA: GNAT family N-acetyltransferase [Rickettsia endosymbiont of Omalisus fontisbellaquei]|nr:GNAT family N-acetyltransferase [Rickettsia endosymbiont of Omalisus fontisbellaquei]